MCTILDCLHPGIRLFYIGRNWQLRSRLIAVRQFNPTVEMLQSNRLSKLLKDYLESAVKEYDDALLPASLVAEKIIITWRSYSLSTLSR